ncbi:MAG: UxaA family hydrolase [Holophaga sp.]|nr:UxaA family hydrolase [Holophaga sp.]
MTQEAKKLDSRDNVATALEQLARGSVAQVLCDDGTHASIPLSEDVPFGFKLATRNIAAGEPILKYGEVIGVASQDIKAGAMVHVHNVDGNRARGDIQGEAK